MVREARKMLVLICGVLHPASSSKKGQNQTRRRHYPVEDTMYLL